MSPLILKRGSATGTGNFGPDDYDVLSDGELVGRIYFDEAASSDAVRWFWPLAYGHHEDRSPTRGARRRARTRWRRLRSHGGGCDRA